MMGTESKGGFFMRDQATRRLAYGGLMAALIALLTAYVH